MKRNYLLNQCILSLVLMAASEGFAQTTNAVEAFVIDVNQAWQSTNYTQIITLIDQRLATNSTDILALSLKLGYYTWAEVSLSNAQQSAIAFLTAVTNAAPEEFEQPCSLVQYAIAVSNIDPPPNPPTDESRTPQQVQYLHESYPISFPNIGQAVFFDSRIDPDE
jgi:hypothetical protein